MVVLVVVPGGHQSVLEPVVRLWAGELARVVRVAGELEGLKKGNGEAGLELTGLTLFP